MIADSASSASGAEGSLPFDSLTQRLFREAVVEVAEQAKSVLPECHDRIEQAVQLLCSGEVQWLPDGTVQMRDAEQEGAFSHVQETCPCPESTQAPRGWCVHRLVGAIAKRTAPLVQARLAALSAPSQPEPPPSEEDGDALDRVTLPPQYSQLPSEEEDGDALDRVTLPPQYSQLPSEEEDGDALDWVTLPSQYIQLIDGKPFVRYAGLLAMAHQRGLQQLEATFLSVTDSLALAQATATFLDGRRFTESGDATPENVHVGVRPHFARLALTRAKARALRDALNIGMAAVEELA